ncbi:hypothetical protein DFH06DRAFT_1196753 [Mycena polygramma]|nr:hypothetical protein DFH06DRAFT_1196753 [Mycena polygramma]
MFSRRGSLSACIHGSHSTLCLLPMLRSCVHTCEARFPLAFQRDSRGLWTQPHLRGTCVTTCTIFSKSLRNRSRCSSLSNSCTGARPSGCRCSTPLYPLRKPRVRTMYSRFTVHGDTNLFFFVCPTVLIRLCGSSRRSRISTSRLPSATRFRSTRRALAPISCVPSS